MSNNYYARITGPGVDHQLLLSDASDFESMHLLLNKIERLICPITACGHEWQVMSINNACSPLDPAQEYAWVQCVKCGDWRK